MGIPTYNAAPLAKTFLLVRGLTLISIITIVGITSYFVSEIVNANIDPPREIIGVLSVTSIAALYSLLSIAYFLAEANVGLFIMTAIDSLLLLAFIIVSVLLGRPLSFMNCAVINNANSAASATDAYSFSESLATSFGTSGSQINFDNWAGNTQANCYEAKTVWGLCIALCVLFACSTLLLPSIWHKARKVRSKDVV